MVRKKVNRNKVNSGKHTFILSSFLVFLILLAVGLFFTNQSLSGKLSQNQASSMHNTIEEGQHKMTLSSFDRELAKQMMDKNNDGKCDECGMPVEMCIDSGQMECNMVADAKIGVLGYDHIHADWKIYLKGKQLDLSKYSHMTRMQKGLSVSS